MIRKLLRRDCCLPWLMLSAVLVTMLLSVAFVFDPSEMDLHPTYSLRFNYKQLDYDESDRTPEDKSDCSAILEGDSDAVDKAKELTITKGYLERFKVPDEYYVNATQDCRRFRSSRKYLQFPLSQEEEEFPLAYSLVVHHKVQSFERLLRAIYAPQNIYCVHVDKKAEISVLAAIMAITSCFPNVFMVSQPVDVVYAAWPRVQADLNCMADLYNVSSTWKYFINLCGQDFPLKTNLEIVRSLRLMRGGNNMESEQMPANKKHRVEWVHYWSVMDGIQGTHEAKGPSPFNLPIMSGSAYILVSRGYVHSVLEDPRIKELILWANDTYSPDEFLWATIQRMRGIPGSVRPNVKYDLSDMSAIARLVKWAWLEGPDGPLETVYPLCQGNHVRSVCVYGAGDLAWMLEQHHLFANKFDTDVDPIALRCLEEYLRHKALAEIH